MDQVPPEQQAIINWFSTFWQSNGKSAHCRHDLPCLQSVLFNSAKCFGLGYMFKTGISIIFSAVKIAKNPAAIKDALLSRQSLNFGLFLATFVGLFKLVICLLRRVCGRDTRKGMLMAGLLSGGVALRLLSRESGKALTLFLFARAVDAIYRNLVLREYLPRWQYDYVLLFSALMIVTGYAYANEPGCMPDDLNRFYLKFTSEQLNDLQMRSLWIEQKNALLALKGIAPTDTLSFIPELRRFYQSQGK